MRLHEDDFARIFDQQIRHVIFTGATAEQRPVTVFLGGQPGAGKTLGASVAMRLNPAHAIIPVIGDDLRRFYPVYTELVRDKPLEMPKKTGHASGRWIARSVSYANENGYSISIEGTWRTLSTVLGAATEAKRLGRATHALVVATPPVLSRLRALSRFVSDALGGQEARWTPPAAQQTIFDALAGNVRAIAASPLIDRFSVASAGHVIYDSAAEGGQAPADKKGTTSADTEGRASATEEGRASAAEAGYQAWAQEYGRALTVQERQKAETAIAAMHRALPSLRVSDDDKSAVTAELDTLTALTGE